MLIYYATGCIKGIEVGSGYRDRENSNGKGVTYYCSYYSLSKFYHYFMVRSLCTHIEGLNQGSGGGCGGWPEARAGVKGTYQPPLMLALLNI